MQPDPFSSLEKPMIRISFFDSLRKISPVPEPCAFSPEIAVHPLA